MLIPSNTPEIRGSRNVCFAENGLCMGEESVDLPLYFISMYRIGHHQGAHSFYRTFVCTSGLLLPTTV